MKHNAVRSFALILALTSALGLFAPAPAASASAVLQPCGDRAYTLLSGMKWDTTLKWSFQASSTPRNIPKGAAALRLQRAARTVATGRNRCGLVSHDTAHQQYLGRTTAHPNILPNGWCGRPDGHSTVGFGTLPAADLALTCYWSRNDVLVESDIMFNKADYRFTAHVSPGCHMTWALRAVATHEFGHAFGLGHVRDPLNEHLTMAPYIYPCQSSESRLGLGDVLGIEALY